MSEIGVKLRFRTNLPAHIKWVEFMAGDDFHKEIITKWQTPAHINRLKRIATQVIDEEIYSVEEGPTYKRTKRLRRSISARGVTGSGAEIGAIELFFDPKIAQAKGPVSGRAKEELNYAAFFDRLEFNSFIRAEQPTDPKRYRPFFDQLAEVFNDNEEKEAMKSLLRAVGRFKPRTIK